jgi:hypothetical protein
MRGKQMPFRDDPDHWRERGAHMRALAAYVTDLDAMAMMFKLADEYDKLADRAEGRSRPPEAKPEPRPSSTDLR